MLLHRLIPALALAVGFFAALPLAHAQQTRIVTLVGVPASLAPSASWLSACVVTQQERAFTIFAALSRAGTVSVQRYANLGCTWPVGAAVPTSPQALTTGGGCPASSYCGNNSLKDELPFIALRITLTDTSGLTNTIVAAALIVGAQ